MPFSNLDSTLKEKINNYNKLYNKAESVLKEYELQANEGIIIPAINELRYSGQHIVRVFNSTDIDEALQSIEEASRHARRSIYDTFDALLIFYIEKCKMFKDDYKNVAITSVNNNYLAESKELKAIIEQIAAEDRTHKENYFKIKEEQVKKVKQIYENWENSREELNKESKKEFQNKLYAAIMIFLACLGIIIAIILS